MAEEEEDRGEKRRRASLMAILNKQPRYQDDDDRLQEVGERRGCWHLINSMLGYPFHIMTLSIKQFNTINTMHCLCLVSLCAPQ